MPLFTFHEIRQLMSVSSSYNFIEATEGTLEKEMLAPLQNLKRIFTMLHKMMIRMNLNEY